MPTSPFHGIFSAFNESNAAAADMEESTASLTEPSENSSKKSSSSSASSSSAQVGQIAVDIYELDNYYIIRAPIAGVKLSDLDIEVDGKVVTIHGKRTLPDDVPSEQYFLQECFWGNFSRSVTLPTNIDPKKVKATFSKDSILKILIPKEDKVKIVRISEG